MQGTQEQGVATAKLDCFQHCLSQAKPTVTSLKSRDRVVSQPYAAHALLHTGSWRLLRCIRVKMLSTHEASRKNNHKKAMVPT